MAKNFKSFDEKYGITYTPSAGLNLIIGENNVGKSNILSIVSELYNYLNNNEGYKQQFMGNKKSVRLIIDLSLNRNESNLILEKLMLRNFKGVKNYSDLFKSIRIIIDSRNTDIEIIFNRYKISKDLRTDTKDQFHISAKGQLNSKSGLVEMDWFEIIKSANSNVKLEELIDKYDQTIVDAEKPTGQKFLILLKLNIRGLVSELLKEKIIIFPEFRNRSIDTLNEDLLGPDGRNLSSILYNLKTGGIQKERIYKKIQRTFRSFFSGLSFDVQKKHPYLYFYYRNKKYEIDHKSIGAGIVETLLIITHLILYDGKVFLIDEPELHLHPHATRNISKFIHEHSSRNQIICSTHSPKLIDLKIGLEELNSKKEDFDRNIIKDSITLVRKKNNKSILKEIDLKKLSKEDLRNLYALDFDETFKEIFFSRLVVLVEGDTEVGALPLLATKLRKSFDSSSISIIGVGGNNFVNHIKMLSLLDIPYLIICDFDTLERIENRVNFEHNSVRSQTSSLFSQLSCLNLLNAEEKTAIQECSNMISEKEREICDKENCIKKKVKDLSYNDKAIEKLRPIAEKHGFLVLTFDFEGVINNSNVYNQASRKFPKSKRLKGIYVGQNVEVPNELKELINLIYSKSVEIKASA